MTTMMMTTMTTTVMEMEMTVEKKNMVLGTMMTMMEMVRERGQDTQRGRQQGGKNITEQEYKTATASPQQHRQTPNRITTQACGSLAQTGFYSY